MFPCDLAIFGIGSLPRGIAPGLSVLITAVGHTALRRLDQRLD